MKGLNNKIVMITGGSAGIGRATASRFYAEGARLCLVDINPDPSLNEEFPERMDFIQGDVSGAEGVARCAAYAADVGLDVLINNAGITRDASIAKMTMDQWDAVIGVNLTAVFRLSQMAAKHMKAQGSGVILNAASVVAHYGNFGRRPGKRHVCPEGFGAHGKVGTTVCLTGQQGYHGHRCLAVSKEHFCTVSDDTTIFLGSAGKESRDVDDRQ